MHRPWTSLSFVNEGGQKKFIEEQEEIKPKVSSKSVDDLIKVETDETPIQTKTKQAKKRKAEITTEDSQEVESKSSKMAPEYDSPGSRRSSRKVVPNRKYLDMVTDMYDTKPAKKSTKTKSESEDEMADDEETDDISDRLYSPKPVPDTKIASPIKPPKPITKPVSIKTPSTASKQVKTPLIVKTPISSTLSKQDHSPPEVYFSPKRPVGRPPVSKDTTTTASTVKSQAVTTKNTPASSPAEIPRPSPSVAPTPGKKAPIAIQSAEMQAAVKEAVRLGKSTTTVKRSCLPAGTSIKTTVVTIERSADNKPRKRIRVITVYPEDSSSESEPEVDDEIDLLPPIGAPPPSPCLTLETEDDELKLDPHEGEFFTGLRPGIGDPIPPIGDPLVSVDQELCDDLNGLKGENLIPCETGDKVRVELVTFSDDRFIEFDAYRGVKLTNAHVKMLQNGRPIYLNQDDAGIKNEPLMFMDVDTNKQPSINNSSDMGMTIAQQNIHSQAYASKQQKPRKQRTPTQPRINTNILRDLMTNQNAPIQNVNVVQNQDKTGSSKALRYVTVVPGPESLANMPAGTTPQTQYVIVEFDEDMSNMPQEKIASLINSVTQGQQEHQTVGITADTLPNTELVIAEEKPATNQSVISGFRRVYDDASSSYMYSCTKCYFSTLCKADLAKHRAKHTYMRAFACKFCSYRAQTSTHLKRHMAIHRNVRAHTCIVCGFKYRQRVHLLRHLRYKHWAKTVCCPLCDFICASEYPDLRNHIDERHSEAVATDEHLIKCVVCDVMFATVSDLQQHMKTHKKGPEIKIRCDKCSFITDCDSRFKRHQLVHTKEKPFACSLCPYRASQKPHVHRHMRSKHSAGNLPIPGRTKKTRTSRDGREATKITQKIVDSLKQMRTMSEEKIFGCNHCSMKFSKLINLYKHLYSQHKELMPDQETNFNCVVCNFNTNNKKNLLIHMRKHNKRSIHSPTHVFTCILCSYVNPKKQNIIQHMSKKHGIEMTTDEHGTTLMTLPQTSDTAGTTIELAQPQPVSTTVSVQSQAVNTQTTGFLNFAPDPPLPLSTQVPTKIPTLPQHMLPQRAPLTKPTMAGPRYANVSTNASPQINVPMQESVQMSNLLPNQQMSILQSGNVMNQLHQLRQNSGVSGPIQVLVENPDKKMISVELADIPTGMDTVMADPAVEAIEGLQALSAQNVDIGAPELIMTNGDLVPDMGMKVDEGVVQQSENQPVTTAEETRSFQLTDEQLMNLSSGDFIEINGEIYKVEFS